MPPACLCLHFWFPARTQQLMWRSGAVEHPRVYFLFAMYLWLLRCSWSAGWLYATQPTRTYMRPLLTGVTMSASIVPGDDWLCASISLTLEHETYTRMSTTLVDLLYGTCWLDKCCRRSSLGYGWATTATVAREIT